MYAIRSYYVSGLFLTAVGFMFLTVAVFQMQHAADMKAAMIWLVLAYLFHTLGELCISPVGLSMVTKLAPRITSYNVCYTKLLRCRRC